MKIELIDVRGFIPAIFGMRLSMQSEGDSIYFGHKKMSDGAKVELIGEEDKALMLKLAKAGDSHGAFMRMIQVWIRLKASRMWWHQWDKYKFQHFMYDVEERSASTMHTIHKDKLEYTNNVVYEATDLVDILIDAYKNNPTEEQFMMIKENLPEGLLQERIVNLNYQTLRTIYQDRQNHRLPEWKELCEWIETLPHSDLITEVR